MWGIRSTSAAVHIDPETMCEEAGSQNAHEVTAHVAQVNPMNCHRDLFRYIRLPVDIVYVPCPVLQEAWRYEKVEERCLPMIDPHELLEYLHHSGYIAVDRHEVAKLGPKKALVLLRVFV